MIEIKAYSGHIRNHKALCKELGIECGQPRENREREIIVNGYKKWGCELPCHIYGMFAFVLSYFSVTSSALFPCITVKQTTADFCSVLR